VILRWVRPVDQQLPADLLARDPRYAEDPPARDIDFCNGGHGFQTFGQDLAWTVFEVEHIRLVHRRAFSTIHAFERRDPHFLAQAAKFRRCRREDEIGLPGFAPGHAAVID